MSDPIKININSTTTTQKSIKLNRVQLLTLIANMGYSIPASASVDVRVPGGGDWSNTDLDIDNRSPIVIHWTETS
jgi:hypothetical protein